MFFRPFLLTACLLASTAALRAGEFTRPTNATAPAVATASDDGLRAIKRFRLQKGLKVGLFAAEPLLANPVAFAIDERGRFYVAETFRLHDGVTDIRGHMSWLDEELASTSVSERVEYMKKHEGKRFINYSRQSDRVRLLWDNDGDGVADKATVFADGFNNPADGIGAGVLARRGSVYYANIPHLWLLRDENHDNISDSKRSLLDGFGVRVGFLGHDLHGLRIGPDGKLYFTIGDRGARVQNRERKIISNLEDGVVYRCDLDGSNFEIFARGLRNPQELAFDAFGNLWTGDNNSDGGDPARWVYLVEGGDSGWRIGWQFLTKPNRGAWLTERLCYPHWEGQAAWIIPPIANIGNGPSGLTHYPGAGLSDRYEGHFFLSDFRGTTGSGVHSFAVKPRGAGFEVVDRHEFIWELLATDCEFGYDGALYVSDWVEGWNKTGKGRIYRVTDPVQAQHPAVAQTKELFARGIAKLPLLELPALLAHPDMRVRQEAQFAIVEHGPTKAVDALGKVVRESTNRFARIHAVWGLGQIVNRSQAALNALNRTLIDRDPEIRAQSAKVLGDAHRGDMKDLIHMLVDESPRARFHAAIALGKLGQLEALTPVIELARANDDKDVFLRHAAVMGITGILRATNGEPLEISAEKYAVLQDATIDKSAAVRMAALLALRNLESPAVADFLHDTEPRLVAEAARAINDLPIVPALTNLATLITNDAIARLPAGDATHPGPRDAILSRVLNANYRLGQPANAALLSAFASAPEAPENFRVEAVNLLASWATPSGRDRLTGLWRPLPERDAQSAADALQPYLAALQTGTSQPLKLAATKAAGKLAIKNTVVSGFELVTNTASPREIRLEALRSLDQQNDPTLGQALSLLMGDADEALRKETTRILARLQPDDALGGIRAALDGGSIGEKQNAFATLGALPGSGADELLAAWLEKLLQKQVPAEITLDLLDAAAKRTNAAVLDRFQRHERARPASDDLRAYREALVGGDADEGKKIFLERAEASCVRCHKVQGEGGDVGPDLTGIGSKREREYFLESIVFPNKQIAAGFENVLVTLKDGTAYAGVLKSETGDMLEINSGEDGIVKVKKADVKRRERGLSGMPEELRQVLSKHDLRNLVEWLASLKETPKAPPVAPAPAPAVKPAPPAE